MELSVSCECNAKSALRGRERKRERETGRRQQAPLAGSGGGVREAALRAGDARACHFNSLSTYNSDLNSMAGAKIMKP